MNEQQIKEIEEQLTRERNERSELLSKARDFHVDKQITFGREYAQYIVKLGELSFIIGAALAPVILVSQPEMKFPFFILLAVGLYLLNGILALWKSKDIVERQLDAFAPGNFHALELKIQPIQFLADKIILDFKEEDIKEYIQLKKEFIVENAEEKASSKVNIFLDVIIMIFITASLLVIRSIWPYSTSLYWHIFGASISIVVLLIIIGALKAKNLAKANNKYTADLNKIKTDHASWWRKRICGEND